MKKILFLFVALSCFGMGAWAQTVVSTPKVSNATTQYLYKMHCSATDHGGNYINVTGETVNGRATEGTFLAFESAGANQWYIKDVASNKYLALDGSNVIVSETPLAWTQDGKFFNANGGHLNNNGALATRPGTGGCSQWVLEEEAKGTENALNGRSETLATSENLTSGKFYVISGYGQTGGDANHFLYDNSGTFATQGTMTTGQDDSSKFAWRLVKNGAGLWSFQNAYSGKYITFEGNSNDSPVTMGEEEKFYTIHWNAEGNIAAFKNSNGQGIDLAYWGTAASTWSDDGSVGGSRRMRIYEAEVVSTVINSYSYTVVVSGVAGGGIVYDETNYANGAAIEDLDAPLTSAELAGAPVDGYNAFVTLSGSTITVLYLPAVPSLGDKEVGSVGEKVTAVEPDKWYLITQTRGEGETPAYATDDNKLYRADASHNVANVAPQGRAASEIAQYLVRFVDSDVEGAKYIQFANGKFWGSSASGNAKLDAALDHADKYIVYQIGASHVGFSQTTDGTTRGRKVDNDGAGYTVGYWESGTVTSETSNAAWYVYPVELVAPTVKANITYVYKLGDETVAEETNAVVVGTELPAPSANLPFYTYTAPEGTVATDKTYTIDLTWDGPFKTDGTTYALGVRLKADGAANYYVKAQGAGEKILSRSLESIEPSAEALWTFERVAGKADQFYVKNVKYGYINTASGAASTTVADTKTPMVLYAYTGTNHQSANKDFGFFDVTNTNQIFGDHQTVSGLKYLGYWSGGSKTDAGSAFQAVATEEIAYNWAAYETRLNQLKAYPLGDGLGQYADVEKVDETFGYSMPLSSWLMGFEYDLEQEATEYYDDDMEIMQWFLDHMSLNMPQKGQMLFIKTSSDWISTPTFLYNEESTASAGRLAFSQPSDEYDEDFRQASTWIYDGQYLVNYANGLTASNNGGFMNIAMYPSTTKVEFLPAANGAIGKYNIRFASSRYLYTNNGLYTDAGTNGNAEGYNFELGDATYYFFLDFGTKGWASGYFPIPVAANPEYGIDAAYYIKNDPENNCFQAEPVGYEGHGLIAPFTPVIIKVNSSINGGRPLVKGAPDYTMQPEESALSGALWKQATPANCCVFNVVDGKPGFYGYTGTTLKHCKAYYAPSTPTESILRINFGEEDVLTGIIEAIEKEEFSGNIFDLQGRRINGVQQGVFVKDGKKVIK